MQRNICGPHENYLRLDFLPNLLGRSVAKPSHFDLDVFTALFRTQDFLMPTCLYSWGSMRLASCLIISFFLVR